MTREQLAHVLRAASEIAGDPNIIVIGSQSILGTWSEARLPARATLSMEADIAFLNDAEERKADRVDGAIGEGSTFNITHGYYGQGVGLEAAVLPSGWRGRVVPFDRLDAGPCRACCLEPHDLVISKLVAGRQKDHEFASALLAEDLISVDLLRERAGELPKALVSRVLRSIDARSRAAAGSHK